FMRYAIWAEAINPALARIVKARYYGEISYLDHCLGRILDAIDARPKSENVLVCFFSDHGDLLGDHHGWQKHNFFEAACRVPLLLSWPAMLSNQVVRNELISLADLFGIATQAAGQCDVREGTNVLKMLRGDHAPRQYLIGMVEPPGSHDFKLMVVTNDWKYIFMANGGREQLFNLRQDPHEFSSCVASASKIRNELHALGVQACQAQGATDALDGEKLRAFPFRERPRTRIYQFDRSRGVVGFPDRPENALKGFDRATLKRIN
ncbi:MAG: sulfatase, partial [Candidatus Udaeobacter sp.]